MVFQKKKYCTPIAVDYEQNELDKSTNMAIIVQLTECQSPYASHSRQKISK